MKIRNGFVSNSSSTSFILAIARNFELPEELKEKLVEEYKEYCWGDGMGEPPTADEIVEEAVNILCSKEATWQEDCSASVTALVHIVTNDKELAKVYYITELDAGPDEGQYINVLCDKERKGFLTQMKIILEKENEN